jgi:DNA-binding NtrC family response regulator
MAKTSGSRPHRRAPPQGDIAPGADQLAKRPCVRHGTRLARPEHVADDGRPIGAEHLSDRIRQAGETPGSSPTLNEAIEQLKCRMIDDALRECGSKTRAAERLGLSRQSLQQMLRRRQA